MTTFADDLFVVHRIRAGSRHGNVLPAPPAGKTLQRIWTLIDADKLATLGPVHNASTFLEDHQHDWRLTSAGELVFYSRVVPTDTDVDIVLDYETMAERDFRMKRPARDPGTGRRMAR